MSRSTIKRVPLNLAFSNYEMKTLKFLFTNLLILQEIKLPNDFHYLSLVVCGPYFGGFFIIKLAFDRGSARDYVGYLGK